MVCLVVPRSLVLLLLPLEMALLVAMCVAVSGVYRVHLGQIPRHSQSGIACLCRLLVGDNISDGMLSWG